MKEPLLQQNMTEGFLTVSYKVIVCIQTLREAVDQMHDYRRECVQLFSPLVDGIKLLSVSAQELVLKYEELWDFKNTEG